MVPVSIYLPVGPERAESQGHGSDPWEEPGCIYQKNLILMRAGVWSVLFTAGPLIPGLVPSQRVAPETFDERTNK